MRFSTAITKGRHAVADPEESVSPEMAKIYRREALEARIGGPRVYGDLIRVSPKWVEWAFWFLVAVVVVVLVWTAAAKAAAFESGSSCCRTPYGAVA